MKNSRPGNPFPFSHTNKRYHTFDHFARELFGQKAARVPLDAGLSCPNRDGTCGWGGCLFCLGGSASSVGDTIEEQYRIGSEVAMRKWPGAALMPYLQAGTNSYGDPAALADLYGRCAALPGARMLIIGTRADCLGAETVGVLRRISERIPVTVELGLQTVHEETLLRIGRGYGHGEFLAGYRRLREAGGDIRLCLHVMNGLPFEDREQMLETVRQAAALGPEMMKIHCTCVLEGTGLREMWGKGEYIPLEMDEYVELLCDQLCLIPPEVVIARICADARREILLAPLWVRNKRAVENLVDRRMRERGEWQGGFCPPDPRVQASDARFSEK